MKPANLILILIYFFASCTAPGEPRTISVTGRGKVKIVPDMVELSLKAYTVKPAMKDAVTATLQAVDEIMAVCKKYVVNPADVKVSSISTNKAYEYRSGREQFVGYDALQVLDVALKDVSKIEQFTEELLATKISKIENIRYNHTKADSILREVNLMALEDARKTAAAEDEKIRFKKLQQNFAAQFESVFPDKMAPKTVVIIPSLTLDAEILQKIDGINYYEERMLCLLMLLRMPHTHLVYITSMPIDPVIVDYYLHLLPGITTYHARQRLTLLSCFDASHKSLTEKILDRPRLIQRIRAAIPHQHLAHLSCFTVTDAERKLALKLHLPIYGCDPDLLNMGNKSNSRKLFRACNIPVPVGYEDLYSEDALVKALVQLKQQNPQLRKAVVKVNEGFSGDGNAVFPYSKEPVQSLDAWIREQLPQQLEINAEGLSYAAFLQKFTAEGGIAEEFVEGDVKLSPSVQCRINPLGKVEIISTHDQRLGGQNGQVYLGASFPADKTIAPAIGEMGRLIAKELRTYGVLGRFAADFISVKEGKSWKHYAIEINLRKGGTTHPYLMLQFLTGGEYNDTEGLYYAANGQPRYYVCTDNLQSNSYKGLTPHDLIDIAMCNDLLYDGSMQEGVIFHLISALSQFGKLGMVCIGASPEKAAYYYNKTVDVLNRECRH